MFGPRKVGCFLVLLGLGACTGPSFDLLDAAREYETHSSALDLSVSKASAETPIARFRQDIRQYLAVENVMLASNGNGELEAVELVLYSYGLSISGRKVGLLYRNSYDPSDFEQYGARYVAACDASALEAFHDPNERVRAVYCRLNEHWLAYQHSY